MFAPPSSIEGYFGLAGHRVLITGATRGIGLAMAEAFAKAGAALVVSSHETEEVAAVVAALRQGGAVVHGAVVDVRDTNQLDGLIAIAIDRLGGVDCLVCNAGVGGPFGSMSEADDQALQDVFAINLKHPLYLASRIAPHMAERGSGSIILTSSIAGLRGNAKIGVYGLTKAALSQLARNLAVEWGPRGLRANAIAPGLIRTSWADAILSSPEASRARLQQTPLRRIGEPWEIAAAALFLAGPGSAFITGQTLVVDGGTLISDGN